MTLATERGAAAPGAAAQGADKKDRPTNANARLEDLEDKKKGVEFEADGELHLRGGAGRASTRYTSTTSRKGPRTRASTGSSSNSRQSYVSYGSGGKANSYVSYGSGQEKKHKKPITARPSETPLEETGCLDYSISATRDMPRKKHHVAWPAGARHPGQGGIFARQGGEDQGQNQAQRGPVRGEKYDIVLDFGVGRRIRVNKNDLVKFPKNRRNEGNSDGGGKKKSCIMM
ncbi:hypothetical protein N431DRAFT_446775 [Stipitochalara longipes BDJ]|nr:hypothetical protein N431DRAFT_446775 [Stipitochalara longipes BDJ]